VRAERGLLVVHLHYPGARADQGAVPHGPHVQRAAPTDDEVGAGDQLGGQRGREATGDAEPELLGLEQPVGDRRGGDQGAAPLGQVLQGLPCSGGAAAAAALWEWGTSEWASALPPATAGTSPANILRREIFATEFEFSLDKTSIAPGCNFGRSERPRAL